MKHPPQTANLEAAALIAKALQKCRWCRLDWRIYAPPPGRGDLSLYTHANRKPCEAQHERAELRRIASEARAREQARKEA